MALDRTPLLSVLLAQAEERGASDLHLAANEVPFLRVQGVLRPLDGADILTEDTLDEVRIQLGNYLFPAGTPDVRARLNAQLAERGAQDGAFTAASGARYRFNIYRQNDSVAVALRRLDDRFRSLQELGLPTRLAQFCNERDGLVIVTGPTGSGKTTTLATLLDGINASRNGHIITIEDPIEYVHKSRQCLVNQRQIGRDAVSFNAALTEAMRQDPDVILVGEMRDLPTARTALRAAETGHLVFTTLHAGDCAGAVERFMSVFPAEEQLSVRQQLALALRGILAQHLLPEPGGKARHPACELLVNTPAVANLIATSRSVQLRSVMETGSALGMLTLDQSLAELYASGLADRPTVFACTHNPEALEGRIHALR